MTRLVRDDGTALDAGGCSPAPDPSSIVEVIRDASSLGCWDQGRVYDDTRVSGVEGSPGRIPPMRRVRVPGARSTQNRVLRPRSRARKAPLLDGLARFETLQPRPQISDLRLVLSDLGILLGKERLVLFDDGVQPLDRG